MVESLRYFLCGAGADQNQTGSLTPQCTNTHTHTFSLMILLHHKLQPSCVDPLFMAPGIGWACGGAASSSAGFSSYSSPSPSSPSPRSSSGRSGRSIWTRSLKIPPLVALAMVRRQQEGWGVERGAAARPRPARRTVPQGPRLRTRTDRALRCVHDQFIFWASVVWIRI